MTGSTGSRRVRVVAGTGVVARAGDVILYVDTSDATLAAVAGAIVDALAPGVVAGDPIAMIERIVAGRPSVPPYVLAFPADDALEMLASDGASVHWHDAGGHHERMGRGTGARDTAPASGSVAIGPAGLEPGDAPEFFDLREGAVPGGGLVLELPAATGGEEPTAEQPAALPPQPEPEPPAPFQVVDLHDEGASEARAPLPVAAADVPAAPASDTAAPPAEAPVVDGIRCVRGHFNHPHARYCAVCGISFQQQTVNTVQGPRPPLGVIVVDDGTAFSLDADYVVGREPELDAEVTSEKARPLVIADEQRSVSRVHADVRLEGWDIMLSDRGSANGTFVYPPSAVAWSQLPAGQTVTLVPGTRVAVGQRTFVYESHHVASQ